LLGTSQMTGCRCDPCRIRRYGRRHAPYPRDECQREAHPGTQTAADERTFTVPRRRSLLIQGAHLDDVWRESKDRAALLSRFVLSGEIPSPIDLPAGCHLHQRCPWAIEGCASGSPSLEQILGDYWLHASEPVRRSLRSRSPGQAPSAPREIELSSRSGRSSKTQLISISVLLSFVRHCLIPARISIIGLLVVTNRLSVLTGDEINGAFK
jgi:oligopeptide/dipeptide ABC transporter ATP-binding protein